LLAKVLRWVYRMDVFGAGSSAWYTDEMSGRRTFGSHRTFLVRPKGRGFKSRPVHQTARSYAASREKTVPPGGSRIVNKKEQLKKKRIQGFGGRI
jgi:hypothetical protein